MAMVLNMLSGPDWEQVKYGRWSSTEHGGNVETNYVYGEGTVRIYADRKSEKPLHVIKVRGIFGEMNKVLGHLAGFQ